MRSRLWSSNAEAVLWVLAATALFSIVFASGKFAGDAAAPLQILFLRYCGGLLAIVAIMVLRPEPFSAWRSNRLGAHLLRAFFGSYGGAAVIHASASMPIVDATAISLLQVVFLIVFGVLLFKERIGRLHWLAIVLCCAGATIVMISRGAFRSFDTAYLIPAGFALTGALFVALETVLIKTLSHSDKALTVLVHVNVFGLVLTMPIALMTWQSTHLVDNWPFVLLGPIAITAQYMVIRGYRMADVSVVGPIDYTWLIFAALIGLVFFQEIPTLGVVMGSVIIATGGVILALIKPIPPRRSYPVTQS
ncbi:MAG: DMT family transporter [Pseudomonadota bacterium]